MLNKKIFSIAQVNRYIKGMMEEDIILSSLCIKGEISNYKRHSSGHLYFTLKDEYSAMNCVCFKSDASALAFEPENGMSVLVYGRISVYEKTGQYQLYAHSIEKEGLGLLYEEFEKLKQKLSAKGYFLVENKRDIPENPQTIGIITSPTGAAVQDIIHIAKRRNRGINLILCPVLVQGENAGKSIASAIDKMNRYGLCDVIILGRGGGSMEDLWAFNEEIVADAIYHSKTPIVSAVGHETDFTISDFTADLRAPTPSAAAEICVPDIGVVIRQFLTMRQSLDRAFDGILNDRKRDYENIISRPVFQNPLQRVYDNQMYLFDMVKRLHYLMEQKLSAGTEKLTYTMNLLESVSPLKIMNKGYGLVLKEDAAVGSIDQIKLGDHIKIRLIDGVLHATVNEKAGVE